MTPAIPTCELCVSDGGIVLVRHEKYRVVAVEGAEAHYRGFCRVIWNAHVKEMSDLSPEDRAHFMQAVFAVEAALRLALNPEKINLASLGNATPHLHWHVIPRFVNDGTYPKPIWAASTMSSSGDAHSSEFVRASDDSWHDAVRKAFA
jgi:diadenosine tetraphosphate (Ap4A) HIT family hydrolase